MENVDGAIKTVNLWTATMIDASGALWIKVAEFIPNLLAFVVILTLGYLMAKIVSAVINRALKAVKIDAFAERIGASAVLRRANIQREVSFILARIVFWLMLLTFLVSATESLGLERVSATIDGFVMYIPKVLGAAFILMIGLFISQFVRDLVTSSAEGIGSDFSAQLGTAAYGLLVIIVGTLAIGQLDLETQLLSNVIGITLLSIGAAIAIAFGLGSRDIAGNILAGNYVRELIKEGDNITIQGQTGIVTQVSAVKTEIQLESGDILSLANGDMIDGQVVRHVT